MPADKEMKNDSNNPFLTYPAKSLNVAMSPNEISTSDHTSPLGEASVFEQPKGSSEEQNMAIAVVKAQRGREMYGVEGLRTGRFMLHRLAPEIKNQIYALVLADGVPGEPAAIEKEPEFTRTLKMPPITMVDRLVRDETLRMWCSGRKFSVQVPQNKDVIEKLEAEQEMVMNLHRMNASGYSTQDMRDIAQIFSDDFAEYLKKAPDRNLCPFRFIGNLTVTYNGRVRVNIQEMESNWEPRSLIVGFHCYDEAAFETANNRNNLKRPNERKQLDPDGTLNFVNFAAVRKQFVAILIETELWFSMIPYTDALLHPMIQPVIKALCMFVTGQEKRPHWIEVIVEDYKYPSTGRGLPWPYYDSDEREHESEPDDGFDIYPDGRFLSSSENSECSGDGEQEDEEDEEDEDQDEEEQENEDQDDEEHYPYRNISDRENDSEDGNTRNYGYGFDAVHGNVEDDNSSIDGHHNSEDDKGPEDTKASEGAHINSGADIDSEVQTEGV
ncbi:hypothetical protein N8I77_002913 [Diaporthe amygdali]|uniref:Uncharacterized protein n=1 Tax=Phomopsis amygdali TaxID=1214568 RepID=A0AAD9W754_PHOAM|nr:hypothetical protein N8I77_002913 [Diaporthe amygdali]